MTRVLLVEDNNADARIIETRLRASVHMFEVERAAELSAALTALIHRQFDLVFLDLTLSDSRGIDTVVQVLRIAPHVPVLVLSGHEDLSTAMNCVKAGASSYLVKQGTLTTEVLEREALYAVERAKNMAALRLILHQSVMATVSNGSALAPHVRRLELALDRTKDYLARNNRVAFDHFSEVLEENHVELTLNELRQFTIPAGEDITERHTLGIELADAQTMLHASRDSTRRLRAAVLGLVLLFAILVLYGVTRGR